MAAALCAVVYAMTRRKRLLRISGFAVAALSLLIVSEVIGAALLNASQPASATSQAAHPNVLPTSLHAAIPTAQAIPVTAATPVAEALRNFSDAWRDLVRISAAALKEHDRAGEDLRTGNAARASGELKNCQDIASGIVGYSSGLQVGMDDGSDLELLAATRRIGDGLRDGCGSARSYLETNAASDFDDAKTRFADVVDAIVRSEFLARAKYQRMGGDPDSLTSFKTALR